MKKHRWFRAFLVVSSFILAIVSCPPSVAASPVFEEAENDKIDFLLATGLPLTFLEQRSSIEIDTLYDISQTYTLQYSVEQQYYYENDFIPHGTIPEADMVLSISKLEAHSPGSPSRLTSVLIYIDYTWTKDHPTVRKQDAITVNWDSSLLQFAEGSFNSADYEESCNSSYVTTTNAQTNPSHLNLAGLGYYAQLRPGSSEENVILKGSASFTLNAKSSIYVGNSYLTQITVEYTHDKAPFLGSISLSYNGLGVSVSTGVLQDSVAKGITVRYAL